MFPVFDTRQSGTSKSTGSSTGRTTSPSAEEKAKQRDEIQIAAYATIFILCMMACTVLNCMERHAEKNKQQELMKKYEYGWPMIYCEDIHRPRHMTQQFDGTVTYADYGRSLKRTDRIALGINIGVFIWLAISISLVAHIFLGGNLSLRFLFVTMIFFAVVFCVLVGITHNQRIDWFDF